MRAQKRIMHRLSNPPRAIQRARLDNLALVPASLLPFRAQYQEIANDLPDGSVLICLPPSNGPQTLILERVASNLRSEGYQVRILSAGRFV